MHIFYIYRFERYKLIVCVCIYMCIHMYIYIHTHELGLGENMSSNTYDDGHMHEEIMHIFQTHHFECVRAFMYAYIHTRMLLFRLADSWYFRELQSTLTVLLSHERNVWLTCVQQIHASTHSTICKFTNPDVTCMK